MGGRSWDAYKLLRSASGETAAIDQNHGWLGSAISRQEDEVTSNAVRRVYRLNAAAVSPVLFLKFLCSGRRQIHKVRRGLMGGKKKQNEYFCCC